MRFLIKYDKHRVFKLATVQSPEGQAILKFYGLPTEKFETMVFVDGENLYLQSTAFLQVMKLLPRSWRLLAVFTFLPKQTRDWLYDRIAFNRYALFGKYDTCLLPSPDHKARLLGEEQ